MSGGQATMPAEAESLVQATQDMSLLESSYEVEVKPGDPQNDTSSTLYSAKTFEELPLDDRILQGLYGNNFKKPSKIQERALPLLLADPPRNIIAQSQSGTGKTAAFVLAILSRIDYDQPTKPQALVLGPTRELVRQIEDVIKAIGTFITELKTEVAVPGAVARDGTVQSAVVVGTPGTVMDLIRRRQLDMSNLKLLVVDEADNMLDMQGLGDQCMRVKQLLPKGIQVALFSATFPEKVMAYAERFAQGADQIRLRQQDLTVKGISQMYMDCPDQSEKYEVLCKLYGLMTIGSSIIFVKTRESASEIKHRMEQDGHKVSVLHSAHEGQNRDDILKDFRSGNSKVLITTNVLARGIDVSSVSLVVNYDIPMKGPPQREEPDAETYLHRVGRTGRFGRVGVSITFVEGKKDLASVETIADQFGIELVQLTPSDWDATEDKVKRVLKCSRAKPGYIPGTSSA